MTPVVAAHLFLALLWAQLGLALIPSWSDGTYYSYGWLVLGAVILFYLLRRREVAAGPDRSSGLPVRPLLLGFLAAGILAIFFLRLVAGANPYWRLLLWSQGLITLGMTCAVLHGTEGTKALRHYLPALLLILIAFPLPSALERGVVQFLTQAVVIVSSDLARSFGIPLEVAETAFLIRGEPLDVNDRCSGIRSFQSSVAIALIVGELLRLVTPARLLVLLLGMVASFVGNTARVLALVQAFYEGGSERLEARHDSAGLISVTGTYLLILGIGFLLDRWFSSSPDSPPSSPGPTAQTA